jgi:PPM family protein phosphatase
MIVELYAKTDVGRVRRGNEDNLLLLDLSKKSSWICSDSSKEPPLEMKRFNVGDAGLVLVVSDGMGGALAGDIASRMAVESVRELLLGRDTDNQPSTSNDDLLDNLHNATIEANKRIYERSLTDPQCNGMGATFTGAAIKDNRLDMVQVGDSRAYLIQGDEIRLITKDQSLVQQLVDVGQITEAEAETHMFRNVILQALGAQSDIIPVTGQLDLKNGDILLLCSDGLSGKLRAADMWNIVSEAGGDLVKACNELIAEANNRGGEDNITVVLARFTGDDAN